MSDEPIDPEADSATPIDADRAAALSAADHVVVVGYDLWTESVLETLRAAGISHAVVVTDEAVARRLRDRGDEVVHAPEIDDAALREAGAERADAVLVATLDDRQNVLAVLTAIDVDGDARVVTFAGEHQDAPKLRNAGADAVVNLGQVVAELVVETALTGDDPERLLTELLGGDVVEADAEGTTLAGPDAAGER